MNPSPRQVRAAVLGSTNVDLVLTVPALPRAGETVLATGSARHAGGKGANQAAALAKLGAAVRLISAVGADEAGQWTLEQLVAAGVDIGAVRTLSGSTTGLAVVTVDADGENSIVVNAGANADVTAPSSYDDVDVVLLSLEIPLPTVHRAAEHAREAGVRVVLNAAPAQALPLELLGCVDVLVVNEGELAALGGDPAPLLQHIGAVVVTRGAAGCTVADGEVTHNLAAPTVSVVDTTGAGDCFAAALTFGFASGWPLARAAQLASAAAALAVTAEGARAGQPTLAEAQALLR